MPVLSQMLQDEASLTTAVEKALRALQGAQESRYTKLIFEIRLPTKLKLKNERYLLAKTFKSIRMECIRMSTSLNFSL